MGMVFLWESHGKRPMGWDRHKLLRDGNGIDKYVSWTTLGLSMGMSFLWESHGKRPKGWDETSINCYAIGWEFFFYFYLQATRLIYEALNQQLLDELPKLLVLSDEVLVTCVVIFIELVRNFQTATLMVGLNIRARMFS